MSVRKAKRRLDRWGRYYEQCPAQTHVTPGALRAYNAWVHQTYAQLNLRLRDEGANWRAGWPRR